MQWERLVPVLSSVSLLKNEAHNVEVADSLPHAALALFFLIFGLGACFGWETGYVRIFAGPVLQKPDLELIVSENGER